MSWSNASLSPALAGKIAIVTGAAGGIGRRVAEVLCERGASVLFADRDAAGAREAALHAGPVASSAELDVTDSGQCNEVVARTVAEHGRVDLVVHCAGILGAHLSRPGGDALVPLLEQDDAGWQRVMDVNLTGGFYIFRAAARAMMSAGHGGAMVAITSGGAVRPLPGRGAYNVSKAGLAMLVKALADEVAPAGIRINAVAPGIIETAMTEALLKDPAKAATFPVPPLGRYGKADDVATAVAFLLGPEAGFITGETLFVDGGTFNG